MKRFMVWAIELVFLFCTSAIAGEPAKKDAAAAPAPAAGEPAKAETKEVKKDAKKEAKKKKKAESKKEGKKKAASRAEVPPAASSSDSTKTTR